jgi:hypothetical protein
MTFTGKLLASLVSPVIGLVFGRTRVRTAGTLGGSTRQEAEGKVQSGVAKTEPADEEFLLAELGPKVREEKAPVGETRMRTTGGSGGNTREKGQFAAAKPRPLYEPPKASEGRSRTSEEKPSAGGTRITSPARSGERIREKAEGTGPSTATKAQPLHKEPPTSERQPDATGVKAPAGETRKKTGISGRSPRGKGEENGQSAESKTQPLAKEHPASEGRPRPIEERAPVDAGKKDRKPRTNHPQTRPDSS